MFYYWPFSISFQIYSTAGVRKPLGKHAPWMVVATLADPSSQTSAMSWGQTWIKDHRDAQATYNKPVLMEEFGVLASQDQIGTYENWYTTVVDSGVTGVLIWQAGSNLTSGPTPNDGYAVCHACRRACVLKFELMDVDCG
jgi:hypothetical protein